MSRLPDRSRERAVFLSFLAVALALALGCGTAPPTGTDGTPTPVPEDSVVRCDVIVIGGSLASLSAGLHAAREGAYTCLVEPTSAVGGQMTVQGVTPPDFAGHRVDSLSVGFMARHSANIAPEFLRWLGMLGNPGRCWVSSWCFTTEAALSVMEDAVNSTPSLVVFRQAVVTAVQRDTRTGESLDGPIVAVEIIEREGSDRAYFLSDVIDDWYTPEPSARYPVKRRRSLIGPEGKPPIVIDGSPFGDVLVLSGARWLQGADATDGGTTTAADTCGLATVFPLALEFRSSPVAPEEWASLGAVNPNDTRFSVGTFGWSRVWTYRRLTSTQDAPTAGDLSMQNWQLGNDYRNAYVFANMATTRAQARGHWRGGIRVDVLRAAEQHALAYAAWYRMQAPDSVRPFIALSRTWANETGLTLMPYFRDARRAIGLDDYVLRGQDFVGPGTQVTGVAYPDRIAIGAYQFDFRTIKGCQYPSYISTTPWALPYYVPFRALTSGDVPNLLVAGKNMAQSTLANTATRLHPIEWTTGIAAGVAAAWMQVNEADTRMAYQRVGEIQHRISRYAQINWTYVRPN